MENEIYPRDISKWPFVKVYQKDFRENLLNIANAITELNLWGWMKEFSPNLDRGFMFTDNTNLDNISDLVEKDGHSGATFAFSMRCMESIAKHGFDDFCASCEE